MLHGFWPLTLPGLLQWSPVTGRLPPVHDYQPDTFLGPCGVGRELNPILRYIEVLNGHQDSIWVVRETLATSLTACSDPRQDGEGQEKLLSALTWKYSLLLRILGGQGWRAASDIAQHALSRVLRK